MQGFIQVVSRGESGGDESRMGSLVVKAEPGIREAALLLSFMDRDGGLLAKLKLYRQGVVGASEAGRAYSKCFI